ncbi:MAG TPA: thiolase family protein, partial [Bellilinea sp.]|nr:thiolase family protein [Bellilinea sp.]
DDVLASPRVAYPYRLFDICPRSAGAAAMVLTNLDVAKNCCTRPAFINGIGAITHTVFMGDKVGPKADTEYADMGELEIAANECYRHAGIINPRSQIQVIELYDPFSSMQFPQLEGLGFCKRGEAAKLSDEGAFDLDGRWPVSPSGGTLCTNPIGVSGLVRGIEASLQVMGRAGKHQINNVHNALATAIGGSAQFFTCTIFGDDYK